MPTLVSTGQLTITDQNDGIDAVNVELSRPNIIFTANNSGTIAPASYTNSGTNITVLAGGQMLDYDGTGTGSGNWKVTVGTGVNITAGTASPSGSSPNRIAVISDHSTMPDANDTASVTYTIQGVTPKGVSFTITKAQNFSKSKSGANSTVKGPKSAVIEAYQWSTSVTRPALPTVTFTYVWSDGSFSSYSSGTALDNGWTTTSTTAPANTERLWKIYKTITESNGDANTTANQSFSGASSMVVGFRRDGTDSTVAGDSVRSANLYVYFKGASVNGPTSQQITDLAFPNNPYNFSTGVLSITSGSETNWSVTPVSVENGKYWYLPVGISQTNNNAQVVTKATTALIGSNFSNLVTFTNLSTSGGSTTINGDNITTGTILANRINTQGLDIKDSDGKTVFSAATVGDYTGLSLVVDPVADCNVRGTTIEKVGTDQNWNTSQVYSNNSFTGAAYVSFKAAVNNKELSIGLNNDPTADRDITTINYHIVLNTLAGWRPWKNNAGLGTGTISFVVGDILSIVYETVTVSGSAKGIVKWYQNGVLKHTLDDETANQALFFDSSFKTTGGKVVEVEFGNTSSFVVSAERMRVGELSAITATIGTLQSGTSGERTVIKTDKIQIFGGSPAVERVRIGNLA